MLEDSSKRCIIRFVVVIELTPIDVPCIFMVPSITEVSDHSLKVVLLSGKSLPVCLKEMKCGEVGKDKAVHLQPVFRKLTCLVQIFCTSIINVWPIFRRSWRREDSVKHPICSVWDLPFRMWLIPPNTAASSSSMPDVFIKVAMQPTNDISMCIKPGWMMTD